MWLEMVFGLSMISTEALLRLVMAVSIQGRVWENEREYDKWRNERNGGMYI